MLLVQRRVAPLREVRLIPCPRCNGSGQITPAAELLDRLTPREREIAGLIGRGMTNADIATELFLSPETIRTHAQNILKKLGLHQRLALVRFADEAGLLGSRP